MSLDRGALLQVIQNARYRDRGVLLESEGMSLLAAAGIAVPRFREVRDSNAVAEIETPPFPGEKIVVKVISPEIQHKTEVGGVTVVHNDCRSVYRSVGDMEKRLGDRHTDGYLLQEFIEHDRSFGHEFLLGMHWTPDFGPIVTVGAGGIHTEFLARALRPEQALAMLSPALSGGATVEQGLAALAPVRLITENQRGHGPEAELGVLAATVRRFLALAGALMPDPIGEFEINPLVLSDGRFVALDALFRFGNPMPAAPPRPLDKIENLLEPASAAVMGVSSKMNPGRLILNNLLVNGFPRDRISVIKPDTESIDGCRCYPSIKALPECVDLVILSITETQAPAAITELVDSKRAESVILIPGGLDEKPENVPLVEQMQAAIAVSRQTPWRGPVINGGNCLGVRSVPGRYNTLFIPEHKLPLPSAEPSPVALLSGSGAFVVAKGSKLAGVNPRYIVSIGNQIDLTLGDYLEYLKDHSEVELFAVYAEGFRPGDGLRFFKAASEITASGRTVVLYRAGRTEAGAAAAASHTAAVAGDYQVTVQLARAAGVLVADTLEEFEDLVRMFALLRDRVVSGRQLGAVSNAGFECVAIADNLGGFTLAKLTEETNSAIRAALEPSRLGEIVTVQNPIDLTPIMTDAGYAAIARSVLLDPGVDVGLIGCVPLTGALNTLAADAAHRDDLNHEDSLVSQMVGLREWTDKAWVAVVDAGLLYDPMAHKLEDAGIPTFRTADRALKLFNIFCGEKIKQQATAPAGDYLTLNPSS
jgi:acyl-CoA synthetase (NDP forming)